MAYYVGKNNNFITINGQRYNAHAGASSSHPKPKAKSVSQPEPIRSRPTMHDVVRSAPKHASSHKQRPSRALMRHAVKKPQHSTKPHIRAQGQTEALVKPSLAEINQTPSIQSVDKKQLARAGRVAKSHLISHFSVTTSDDNKLHLAPLPAPLPIEPPEAAPKGKKLSDKPKTTAELLEHAIKQANSHESAEHKPKRGKKRRSGMALASVAAVLMLAFVGYQELPNMKLEIASTKAGFSATLPDYKPSGYSLSELDYGPGVVATKFTSNSDSRAYTLTQKTSDWDSQALRDSYVSQRSHNYQTVETGGRTIYLYDGNATWVNGGIWYIVQSNGSLSNQQLINLAKSI